MTSNITFASQSKHIAVRETLPPEPCPPAPLLLEDETHYSARHRKKCWAPETQ